MKPFMRRSSMKVIFNVKCVRNYSKAEEPKHLPPVHKAVVVSTSKDIFTNLALENWFYRHQAFTNNHLLMMWVNDPCVVIGRHQNPWCEADVEILNTSRIQLARRNSGGGTVYHDGGNLNLTFFTPREHYNRKFNLSFIATAVGQKYGLKVDISPRDDLTVRDYKISGTAAKVARLCAYHHCTLLVNANKEMLRNSLHGSQQWQIKTNATKSMKSKILNLSEENATIQVENLLKTIGIAYLQHNNLNFTENNPQLHAKISNLNVDFTNENSNFLRNKVDFDSLKFHLINPSEVNFPGLKQMREQLADWKWIFGKTPKFTISRLFKIEPKIEIDPTRSNTYVLDVNILVESGKIEEITTKIPTNFSEHNFHDEIKEINELKGRIFSENILKDIENVFKEDEIKILSKQTSE